MKKINKIDEYEKEYKEFYKKNDFTKKSENYTALSVLIKKVQKYQRFLYKHGSLLLYTRADKLLLQMYHTRQRLRE